MSTRVAFDPAIDQQLAAERSSYSHVVRLHSELMRSITDRFARGLLRKCGRNRPLRRELLEEITELIRDPDPELSLTLSARAPIRVLQSRFEIAPIDPLLLWRELGSKRKHMPPPVRHAARILNVGSRRVPTWADISRYVASLGFEAFPVQGFVGLSMYCFLIDQGLFPVSTLWVRRDRALPYFVRPADVFHDLGHALAAAMPDYRNGLKSFSKAVCAQERGLSNAEAAFYRFFERAYLLHPDGTAEPIGSMSMSFETLRVSDGRTVPVQRIAREKLALQDRVHYFRSRKEWCDKLDRMIVSFRGASK